MPRNLYISNRLTDSICNYLDHLTETHHYQISVHRIDGNIQENWYRFIKYYFHECALCREVKRSSSAWKHCISRQKKVQNAVNDSCICGTCHAGVTEYVFPLKNISGKTLGFLCVSGYTMNLSQSIERAKFISAKYNLSKEHMLRAANMLNPNLPDRSTLTAQISPILEMFSALFYFDSLEYELQSTAQNREAMYYRILNHTNRKYRDHDFSLNLLCSKLNIGYSYASHIFSEFNELPFSRYLRRLRIETAKKYLEHTNETISSIAELSGFNDSNYFSNVFHVETGMTPTQWREENFKINTH